MQGHRGKVGLNMLHPGLSAKSHAARCWTPTSVLPEKIEGLSDASRNWPRSRAPFHPDVTQMHNVLKLRLKGWCHVVHDARCFSDPYCGSNRRHTGHHPEIICGVCSSPNFRHWLIRLKHKVAQEVAQLGTDKMLRIAFYCRSGKHRRVTATYILQHILEKSRL